MHATVILLIAIDVVLNVGGFCNRLEKGNSAYVFLAVIHYCTNHTNAVLCDAAAKGLKKGKRPFISLQCYDEEKTLKPYLNLGSVEMVETSICQQISHTVLKCILHRAVVTTGF